MRSMTEQSTIRRPVIGKNLAPPPLTYERHVRSDAGSLADSGAAEPDLSLRSLGTG